MANGTDSDEYVVLSKIRPGLKREFAFAMRSQSQYVGGSGGRRTRASLSRTTPEENQTRNKKLGSNENLKERETESQIEERKLVTDTEERLLIHSDEEEPRSDVVDASTNEESKPVEPMQPETKNDAVDIVNSKLELKMSKKVELKRFPTRLKELLETGLLEGLPVKYLRGVKVREQSEMGLRGVIKGNGIACYCTNCHGAQVVTPNQFELHAGSANKRPPEYIYLENGNTLRDVLNACKNAPLEELENVIKNVVGLAKSQQTTCLNCKGSIAQTGDRKTKLLCDSCLASKESRSSAQLSDRSDRSTLSVSAPNSSSRFTNSSSTRSKGHGRLTRKDLRMHKLVFEENVLPDGTALSYVARGEKLLEGYKKGFAIFCFCCNTEVSPSQFEAHAGWASRRKPYLHIYTSNGVSLHELSIRLAAEKKFSADENDDLCSICQDGGDLLLCDNCPRAFHPDCVSLSDVPQGTWYCKNCQNMLQKEKSVERNVNALAAGRVAGVDPIEQITNRCIRIVSTPDSQPVCVLCSAHDYTEQVFGPRTVIICDQCELEYHVGCLKEHKIDNLNELPGGTWFCCKDCNRIHSALQDLVNGGEKVLPSSLLESIKKKQEQKGTEGIADLDIRWRLLRGKVNSDESKILLSKAVTIFHDQFDPIADSSTSRLDLIPEMVYGRDSKKVGKDFGGMYCAILTVNSTIVSAGIIRIFGKDVAELPLVATSTDSQGQGYFQSLFSCIERLLGSLHVNSLVLPAADEAESIWTKKFGFAKMTKDELAQYRKFHQMLIFEGTSMLHKPVTSPEVSVM